MPIAYHDGAYVDKNDIKIGLSDFGFSRGLTFAESMRVYGGAPFHLEDHYRRLQEGVAILGLSLPLSVERTRDVVRRLCARNNFPHSVVRFYFTAGESQTTPLRIGGDYGFSPHFIVVEDEMKPDHPEAPNGLDYYRRGQRLRIVPYERFLPKAKSVNYLQAFYAAREAGPEWDDILFTHRDGYVTEASRANFFCVIGGVLCTPDKNILDGVTRMAVLGIARELGLPVAERELTPADLKKATEAFTTGSYAELVPVKRIDEHVLPATMDAPVFCRLRNAYTSKIEEARRSYAEATGER